MIQIFSLDRVSCLLNSRFAKVWVQTRETTTQQIRSSALHLGRQETHIDIFQSWGILLPKWSRSIFLHVWRTKGVTWRRIWVTNAHLVLQPVLKHMFIFLCSCFVQQLCLACALWFWHIVGLLLIFSKRFYCPFSDEILLAKLKTTQSVCFFRVQKNLPSECVRKSGCANHQSQMTIWAGSHQVNSTNICFSQRRQTRSNCQSSTSTLDGFGAVICVREHVSN